MYNNDVQQFCLGLPEILLSTSAALFLIAAFVESMFAVIVSSWWPYHLLAPAGQQYRFLDASGLAAAFSVLRFALYGCGAFSIFALFTLSSSPSAVRFTGFVIIIFCPWTSVAVLTMENSSFNLDSNLRLFFRLSLSVLDLLFLPRVAGYLATSSSLSSSSSWLSLSLALCMMPCNMFAFTSSMTRPPLRCTENCFG